MNLEKIQRLIDEIDALPPSAEARAQITRIKPEGYLLVTANQSGLIQFARAFLKAALEPIQSGHLPFDAPLEMQVLNSSNDCKIGLIEHAEIVPIPDAVIAQRRRSVWWKDGFWHLGCATMGFLILFILISGILFWIAVFADLAR